MNRSPRSTGSSTSTTSPTPTTRSQARCTWPSSTPAKPGFTARTPTWPPASRLLPDHPHQTGANASGCMSPSSHPHPSGPKTAGGHSPTASTPPSPPETTGPHSPPRSTEPQPAERTSPGCSPNSPQPHHYPTDGQQPNCNNRLLADIDVSITATNRDFSVDTAADPAARREPPHPPLAPTGDRRRADLADEQHQRCEPSLPRALPGEGQLLSGLPDHALTSGRVSQGRHATDDAVGTSEPGEALDNPVNSRNLSFLNRKNEGGRTLRARHLPKGIGRSGSTRRTCGPGA